MVFVLNESSISKITHLKPDEEDKLEKNIVWVFGYDKTRIGKLGKLLSAHTYLMSEPLIISHIDFYRWGNNSANSFFNSMQKKGKNPKYDYFFFKGFQQTWKVYLRKLILNRIYAQFHDLEKKIVITETNGWIGAETILNILPNSKMIILLEDGAKVIMKKVYSHETFPNSTKLPIWVSLNNRKSLIEFRTKLWEFQTNTLINAFENHDKKLVLKVKFEDLQKNVTNIVEKFFKFLEIEISKNDVQKFIDENNTYQQSTTNKKANPQNFNQEEITMIKNMIKKNMIKIGYSNYQ